MDGGILYRRYRNDTGELLPALRETNGFEMIDPFAAPNAREDLQFFLLTIRGNQSQKRRADHFVGAVSVDVLSPEVPIGDQAVQILSDNRSVGRGDDGRQST